jgi:hypothetical protein
VISFTSCQLARPRLHRVEDHHRPVDRLAEALQAVDQVEREAVCRTGRNSQQLRQPIVAQRPHPIPHRLRRVAGAIRVVQQQQVERVDADPLE